MRLFGFAAIVLFILGLVCVAVPTHIAGGGWPVWDTAGAVAAVVELFLGPVSGWVVARRPPQ